MGGGENPVRIHRIISAALAVLVLAGCIDQQERIDKLEATNLRQRETIAQFEIAFDQDYASRMAKFEQAERHAAIATGCMRLINVCPNSITAPGVAAIAQGHSGGGSFLFWAIYLGKLVFALVVMGCGLALWTMRLRPDLNANQLAREALLATQKACEDTQEATRRATTHAIVEQQGLRNQIEALRVSCDELDKELESRQIALANLQEEISELEAARSALRVFKK